MTVQGWRAPRVVASIEARMGSSRFPGKVLADLNGEPALTRLIHRLRRVEGLSDVVLATTTSAADDALEAWAADEEVAIYRGSEDDVLRRVVEAQQSVDGEVVVQVTGDCVLHDPELIDVAIETFHHNDCDIVTNTTKRSFPDGMDIQVYDLAHLVEVDDRTDDPAVREHVSLYFYENPERYRIIHLFAPRRWAKPDLRFVLDYREDLALLTELHKRIEPTYGDEFGLEEMMAVVRGEPELLAINSHCIDKPAR